METREFVQRKNNHFLWTMKIVPEVWWIYQDLGLLNKKRPVLGLYLSKQAGSGLFAKMRPSVAALFNSNISLGLISSESRSCKGPVPMQSRSCFRSDISQTWVYKLSERTDSVFKC